jgi:ATP-dependent RNA helicase RhlE
MPNTSDAYTHRIGRTGRAEREGKAYTCVTADDHAMVREVERRIAGSIPRRTVEGIDAAPLPADAPRRTPGRRRRRYRRVS